MCWQVVDVDGNFDMVGGVLLLGDVDFYYSVNEFVGGGLGVIWNVLMGFEMCLCLFGDDFVLFGQVIMLFFEGGVFWIFCNGDIFVVGV